MTYYDFLDAVEYGTDKEKLEAEIELLGNIDYGNDPLQR